MFPKWWQPIEYLGAPFAIALLFSILAAFLLRIVIRTEPRGWRRRWRLAVKGVVLVAMGIGVSFMGNVIVRSWWFAATVRADRIARVAVFAINDNATGRPLVDITDRETIRAGLRHLERATVRWPNHESPRNGYRIRFYFDGDERPSSCELLAFRECEWVGSEGFPQRVSMLRPAFDGSGSQLGYYDCPEFWQWLKEQIDAKREVIICE